MTHNSALYMVMLSAAVLVICVASIAYRLQKLAAQRVDAEQRASVAFAEMSRATKELRARHSNDPAEDPALTPGERLQRMYPGVQPPAAMSKDQSS